MSEHLGQAALYAAMLILPLSALLTRKVPLSRVAVLALAWIGIFGVALLAVAMVSKETKRGSGARTTARLSTDTIGAHERATVPNFT